MIYDFVCHSSSLISLKNGSLYFTLGALQNVKLSINQSVGWIENGNGKENLENISIQIVKYCNIYIQH